MADDADARPRRLPRTTAPGRTGGRCACAGTLDRRTGRNVDDAMHAVGTSHRRARQREHLVPDAAARRLDAQKKSLIATERDEEARAAWRAMAATIAAERLVFIDESGFHTRMTPLYACAPRGQRAYGYVPRNHTHNTTLVAALSLAGVGDTMAIEGAMDGPAFIAWLEQGLGPTLVPGQVVVMDNLNVHKGHRVRAVIEAWGCTPLFLPAYSPDLTPIEGMFSKVKTAVRRAGRREQREVEAAIGAALDTVTADDATGWFTHCGYPPPQGQPLCDPL